jgi:hypothetical protein
MVAGLVNLEQTVFGSANNIKKFSLMIKLILRLKAVIYRFYPSKVTPQIFTPLFF